MEPKDKLPPLLPEATEFDDGKTPVTEPPFIPGPERRPESPELEAEREVADLRAALAEVDRLRALLANAVAEIDELSRERDRAMERASKLAEEVARLRRR